MKRWIFAAVCLLLIAPTPVLADTIITVDAKDKPLQIKGWLNEENTLIGSIRLSAPAKVEQFTFLASDLQRQSGDEIIPRQKISFIGETKLQAGIPKDFQVKVSNPESPGTYKGQIEILLPTQKPEIIDINVLVKARPNFKFRTQATYWFARPLFSLMLLLGLSVVGLRSLYVQKGSTFGADPFSDYLGLFIWGLSADVASRSLSNLTGEEEKLN